MEDPLSHIDAVKIHRAIQRLDDQKPSGPDYAKWSGITLALVTAFGSFMYQYGSMSTQAASLKEALAEQRVVSTSVTKLETEMEHVKDALNRLERKLQ